MTEEELAVCEECWIKYKQISITYLCRKLKSDIQHSSKVKKEFEEYMKRCKFDIDEDEE